MRAILLAGFLLCAIPAHAQSFLEIHAQCGKPIHLTGYLDGEYRSVPIEAYALNSDLQAFFEKVYADLPVVDGKPSFIVFDHPLPAGQTCPVAA